jgi:phosphopentomutase
MQPYFDPTRKTTSKNMEDFLQKINKKNDITSIFPYFKKSDHHIGHKRKPIHLAIQVVKA